MNNLNAKSITELAELVRTHQASPIEIMQAHLDRIEQINPTLNALVTLAPNLLEQATEADSAVMRGDKLGLLHGVPLTIKATIETAGLRTTSGSMMRADFVPTRDAQAVARLKAAGAIILGKTNAAEMAMDYTADNPVFGRTNNPHNPLLTPGGSSGGEAAAIATCMSAGGLGSDLAGSIRIPAKCSLRRARSAMPGMASRSRRSNHLASGLKSARGSGLASMMSTTACGGRR